MFDDYLDLLGRPYKLHGRGPDEYDCYGLCMEVLKRRGIALPQEIYLDTHESWAETVAHAKVTDFVRLEKPRPFCIVTFIVAPPLVTHIGVVLEDCRKFINTRNKVNVCIEKLNHPFWKGRNHCWNGRGDF